MDSLHRRLHLIIVISVMLLLILTSAGTIVEHSHQNESTSHVNLRVSQSYNGVLGLYNKSSQQVDPYRSYISEPAPIGIADYGIGNRGLPYNYSTSSFMGNVTIESISMYSPSVHSYNVTFQLNVNLVFSYRSNQYDYWIQDVAYLNTSSLQITFIDNIWNLSAPNANMYNSTILGNGTIGNTGSKSGPSQFYYDFANSSLPGNNISLTTNSSFLLKVNTNLGPGNSPEVSFLYNDGHGWVVYDKAVFYFASKLNHNPYFYVSGYSYNPANTYYDAELIIGGPGNSSQSEDISSSILLMLEYYNGNNYQTIQNAFNFGGDTGETVYNAIGGWTYGSITGRVAAYVQGGSGPLGQLYNSSELSSLKIITNISSGALYVKSLNYTGKPLNVTSFVGGILNVTLFPGKYSIEIYDFATGEVKNYGSVTLSAGKETLLPNSTYEVSFQENGLPAGASWYLNVSGINSGSILTDQYSVYLHNGTYNFTTFSTDKDYRDLNESGVIVVNGTSLQVEIRFVPYLFNISFVESGLPSGTMWSVSLNGKGTVNSTNDVINFSVPNGTYNFVIPRTGNYALNSSTGTVIVNGTNITKLEVFQILDGYLTGKIRPSTAVILVNGTSYNAINGKYNISLKPGNYSVKFIAPGYLNYTTNVTVTSLNSTNLKTIELIQKFDYTFLLIIPLIIFLVLGALVMRHRKKR